MLAKTSTLSLYAMSLLVVASAPNAGAIAKTLAVQGAVASTTPLARTRLTKAVVSFSIKDAVGKWHAPYGSTTFEFQMDGTVIDNLHSARGKSSGKMQRGSNLAVTFAGNHACYYTALLQKDGKKLFLAEKPPKAQNWPCFTGVLVKSY